MVKTNVLLLPSEWVIFLGMMTSNRKFKALYLLMTTAF